MPGAVTIFVDAPLDELERRLRERATESAGEIERADRARAASRSELAGEFDHVVAERRPRAGRGRVSSRSSSGSWPRRLPWPRR